MIKKIFIGFAALIVILFAVAAIKSPEMKVTRELQMSATAEAIFPYINNSKKSYEWMPWAEGDPGLVINYSGPDEGVGAISNWSGKEMGVGRSEVVESVQNQLVKTQLTYTEPMGMSQLAEISLIPNRDGTIVRWSVSGHNNFFFRLMGLLVDCDKMIGGEFEKGLKKLQTIVEAKTK